MKNVITRLCSQTISHIFLRPFNSEEDDQNYLLGCQWPYLLKLFEVPTTLSYVGSHFHGQKQITRKNPHWKAIRTYAWEPSPQVNGSEPRLLLCYLFHVIHVFLGVSSVMHPKLSICFQYFLICAFEFIFVGPKDY